MYMIDQYHLMENDVDQIIPNLWLGNAVSANDAKFIEMAHIKYIVKILDAETYTFPNIVYYNIPIKDKKVCANENEGLMTNYIDGAIKFIVDGLQHGYGVFVHCRKGHHRSANIVLIFMMKYLGIGYVHGVSYINSIRPYALRRNTCVNKWILDYYRKNLQSFERYDVQI